MRCYHYRWINIGAWSFYPELMVAQNWHNGAIADFIRTDRGWQISCQGCPAPYMLKQLGEWFGNWITGALAKPQEPA